VAASIRLVDLTEAGQVSRRPDLLKIDRWAADRDQAGHAETEMRRALGYGG